MKRIAMSLGAITFVAALAYGATGAFFSDTETSAGNTFTAGAIDLTVDSTSHYNGNVCTQTSPGVFTWVGDATYPTGPCNESWLPTNLGPTNQFFNFGDVKPGDNGEDTISMHLDNNPAWACADIGLNGNADNGINGPEAAAGDVTDGPFAGELAQNLSVLIWNDNASTNGAVPGDNIYQTGEQILKGPATLASLFAGGGTAAGTTTIALADSTTGGVPLGGGSNNFIGIEWCAGTFTGTPGVDLACDGSTMGNNTQTDSATSTVTLRVVQSRNNANFTCIVPPVQNPQP